MATPALRHDFVDERAPLANELPAAEYNQNAVRTDDAWDKAVAALAREDFTTAEKAKLAGVAPSATANDTNANLKNRANHTGTQTSATIADFTEAVQDAVGAFLGAGSNVVVTYDDAANTLTIAATGAGGGGLDAETVRDVIGAAIIGVGNITVAYNDGLDTITVSTSATVNSTDAALRDRGTHTGTQSADSIVDGATNHAFTATDDAKLGGVATGATANDTDANLKNRANHTGSQLASTISDFTEAAQDALAAALAGTTGVTVTYNDAANTITVSGLGDTSATAETIRDTIGVAMAGVGLINVTVNDGLDTITISTTATQNSSDASLLARGNHTGSQLSSTISDLTESVQDIVGALLTDGTGIDVVYDDAGNIITINSTASGASGYKAFLGAVAATPLAPVSVTVNHGLNLGAVGVRMRRTWLQTGALGNASPGDDVPIKHRWIDENNVALEFVDPAAANEYEVLVFPLNIAMDTTGPGAGVLTSPAQGLTTVDLSLAGGTDAETALAGVYWYRVIAGVDTLINTTPGSTVTATGLTPNTAYDFKAKRFNLNGKPGTVSNTLNISTVAPSDVTAIGAVVENSAAAASATVRPVYAAGSLRIAVAYVHLNHSEWYASSTYTQRVIGTQSGAWTKVPEGATLPDVGGNFAQPSGGVHMFYKLNPDTAWTADDVTVDKVAGAQNPTISRASIKIKQYAFVDQTNPFGTVLVQQNNMPVAAFGVALNAGDYSLFACANNNTAPTGNNGYNRTVIGTYLGADNSGYSDFFMAGDVASPTATTLNHSTSSGASGVAYAAMVAQLKKA